MGIQTTDLITSMLKLAEQQSSRVIGKAFETDMIAQAIIYNTPKKELAHFTSLNKGQRRAWVENKIKRLNKEKETDRMAQKILDYATPRELARFAGLSKKKRNEWVKNILNILDD